MDNPVPARLRGKTSPDTPQRPAPARPPVKGSAPSSTPDLDEVVRRVQARLPHVRWAQLQVIHRADDDGLWFFWDPDLPGEVQIESSFSACPFLVETDKHDGRVTANTPEETANAIIEWLALPGGRAVSPWHAR